MSVYSNVDILHVSNKPITLTTMINNTNYKSRKNYIEYDTGTFYLRVNVGMTATGKKNKRVGFRQCYF